MLFDQLWQQDEVIWLNSQTWSINSLQIDMSFVMRRQFWPVQKCTGDAAHFLETSFFSQMALMYPQVGCLYIQHHLKCLCCLHYSVSKIESFSPMVQLFERKTDAFWDGSSFKSFICFVCPFLSLILFLKLILLMHLISELADDLIFLFSYHISELWTALEKKSFVGSVVLHALLPQSHSLNTFEFSFLFKSLISYRCQTSFC